MPFWRRAFWRSYWIALQRSGKDKRARRIAGTVSLLIVYIPIYILIFFVLPFRTREGVWQILFDGFIFGAGGVAFVLLRRSHRHQNDLLNYSITGAEPRDIIPKKVAPAVQDYLKERSIILATLLLRGCGELLIARPDLTHGFEVIARQNQNSLLRERGLWDKLELFEYSLMSSSDGSWTDEQKNMVLQWCEQLRLLRWTLDIDSELLPLADFPRVDFSLATDLLGREFDFSSIRMREAWELRVQGDAASEYLYRLIAEMNARKLISADVTFEKWADDLRSKSLGESTDYLAGATSIEELDDDNLRLITSTARARELYAAYLVGQLRGTTCVPFTGSVQ